MARMDANQRRHTQRCSVAGVASKRGYARHRPEDTVLYQVVEQHLGLFFDSLSEQGASLPGFVVEEFDARDIVQRREQALSAMPSNMFQMMTADGLLDLVEYLSTFRKSER